MIEPTEADIRAVEAQYGPLPENPTVEERTERWRLYQAQALIGALGATQKPSRRAAVHRAISAATGGAV